MTRDTIFSIIGVLYVVCCIGFIIAWPYNAYKLSKCDFKEPYRCEVIHTVGLLPPLQAVTIWFDVDK